MWSLKNPELINTRTDWWLPEVGVGGMQMGEGDQKVQISSYKINKPWGCNVQHGDYS